MFSNLKLEYASNWLIARWEIITIIILHKRHNFITIAPMSNACYLSGIKYRGQFAYTARLQHRRPDLILYPLRERLHQIISSVNSVFRPAFILCPIMFIVTITCKIFSHPYHSIKGPILISTLSQILLLTPAVFPQKICTDDLRDPQLQWLHFN